MSRALPVTAGQFREGNARIEAALKQPGLPARRVRRSNSSARAWRACARTRASPGPRSRPECATDPDLTDAEFGRWDAQGLVEHTSIDGHRMYFDRSPSNLFHLSAAARARSMVPIPFTDSGLSKLFTKETTAYDSDVVRRSRAGFKRPSLH